MRRAKAPHARRTESPKVERKQAVTEVPDALSELHIKREIRRVHWIDLIAPSITALSIVLGVWQFNRERAEESKLEFRRNVWTRQIESYSRLGETVGELVNFRVDLDDTLLVEEVAEFDSIMKPFQRYSFGTLPLFQDAHVRDAIRAFSSAIYDYKTRARPFENVALTGIELMEVCKVSSDSTWNKISDE